jgi:hypothetical protein
LSHNNNAVSGESAWSFFCERHLRKRSTRPNTSNPLAP